jgi:hypothetical protein
MIRLQVSEQFVESALSAWPSGSVSACGVIGCEIESRQDIWW